MKLLKFLLVCILFVGLKAQEKGVPCYTCLGRDLDNCEIGLTRCPEECMKLVDTKHNLIAKGCKSDKYPRVGGGVADDGDEVELSNVELPFFNNEPIIGKAYFCKDQPKDGKYCNAASTVVLSFTIMCSALLLVLMYRSV